MFLSCGLVSKNHMLLNLPGILIPQNANHLLPGLFLCQLKSLNSDSKMRGPTERTLWFEDHCSTFLPLTRRPLSPWPQKKFIMDQQIANPCQREGHCRKSWRSCLLFPTHFTHVLCNTNSVFFGPFLTDGPLLRRIIVFQTFLALRLLRW